MDDRLEEVLKLQEEVIKGITRSSSSLRGVFALCKAADWRAGSAEGTVRAGRG